MAPPKMLINAQKEQIYRVGTAECGEIWLNTWNFNKNVTN
jgi:hypothetical protein